MPPDGRPGRCDVEPSRQGQGEIPRAQREGTRQQGGGPVHTPRGMGQGHDKKTTRWVELVGVVLLGVHLLEFGIHSVLL